MMRTQMPLCCLLVVLGTSVVMGQDHGAKNKTASADQSVRDLSARYGFKVTVGAPSDSAKERAKWPRFRSQKGGFWRDLMTLETVLDARVDYWLVDGNEVQLDVLAGPSRVISAWASERYRLSYALLENGKIDVHGKPEVGTVLQLEALPGPFICGVGYRPPDGQKAEVLAWAAFGSALLDAGIERVPTEFDGNVTVHVVHAFNHVRIPANPGASATDPRSTLVRSVTVLDCRRALNDETDGGATPDGNGIVIKIQLDGDMSGKEPCWYRDCILTGKKGAVSSAGRFCGHEEGKGKYVCNLLFPGEIADGPFVLEMPVPSAVEQVVLNNRSLRRIK